MLQDTESVAAMLHRWCVKGKTLSYEKFIMNNYYAAFVGGVDEQVHERAWRGGCQQLGVCLLCCSSRRWMLLVGGW